MNIALEKTAEYVNGTKRREYGDAFVRGNNGKRIVSFMATKAMRLTQHSDVHFSGLINFTIESRIMKRK